MAAVEFLAFALLAVFAVVTVEYFHAYHVGRQALRRSAGADAGASPSARRTGRRAPFAWAERALAASWPALASARRLLRTPLGLAVACGGLALGLAPEARAHDVHAAFDVRSVSARAWEGALTRDVSGKVTAELRSRRVAGRRWHVRMRWTATAEERSFAARLDGVLNLRARRVVLDGRVVSGFHAGAAVRVRGQLGKRGTQRLRGTLTVVSSHADRRRTASAPAAPGRVGCADPCVFIWVVRHGEGRVVSVFGDSHGDIDCGPRCTNSFNSAALKEVVLTAGEGSFAGWRDCPAPSGERCTVPLDGGVHCIRAFFGDTSAPVSAGSCRADPHVDTTPPETFVTAGPPARTRSRTAVLRFSSSEGGSTFTCRLDARPWRACTSPVTYRRLAPGPHVFHVVARDTAGNVDATPSVRRWRVTRAR